MSPNAIQGEQGAYVPCLEAAAEVPAVPAGVIRGQEGGFVPLNTEAAALPATPTGVIVGSSGAYVEDIPSSEMSVIKIIHILAEDGVEISREDDLLGPGNPEYVISTVAWGVVQEGDPGDGPGPVHDFEFRTYFRFDVSFLSPDAEFYRLRARLLEEGAGVPVTWELWLADPAWTDSVSPPFPPLFDGGGRLLATDIITRPLDLDPSINATMDIDVTWRADHPRFVWFYFKNVSPQGFLIFTDPIVAIDRGDYVDRFDYGAAEHFNEGGESALGIQFRPNDPGVPDAGLHGMEVTAISACV